MCGLEIFAYNMSYCSPSHKSSLHISYIYIYIYIKWVINSAPEVNLDCKYVKMLVLGFLEPNTKLLINIFILPYLLL